MTESPFAPLRYYLARGPVPRTSMGVTPLSSLLRAHAPDHVPPPACGRPSVWGSVQVAASPCCDVVLPDVISACLSLDAWTLTPAARWVPVPIASPPPSAFPQSSWGRLPASIRSATSEREVMSGLQSFAHVQAPILARPPGCSYRDSSVTSHRAARPFTPRKERVVTLHELWHRYISESSN